MRTSTTTHHLSTLRAKKHRESKIKDGFKRIQKWVFDIESATIQQKVKKDLANYRQTKEEKEWNEFASRQANKLKGWK